MKIRSITIGMARKYYIGNYESFQIEGAVTVDLDPGETEIEAARKSFPVLREQMKATFQEFKPKRKESK